MGEMMLITLGLVLAYFMLVFAIAVIKKDNSVVDVAWGGGFILVALSTYFVIDSPTIRQSLVTFLVLLWGIRLGGHIYLRSRGRGEDFRYANMRKGWGENELIHSFFKVFLLQAVLCWIISLPVFWINTMDSAGSLTWLDGVGLTVWIIGFFFEAVGDFQLYLFKKNPKHRGKIIETGLWRYTRHPNYFGEATLWWGIGIIVLQVPYGWWTLLSPLLLNFLLLKVSGVPMLEEKYEGRDDWEAYARRTSRFIPWLPSR